MTWTDPQWWTDFAPLLAGAVAFLTAAWALGKRIVPIIRRIGHLIDDLTGEPERPGVPARPGVMERLQNMEERTAELVRNHGSSIKDVVHRLDERTARTEEQVGDIDARLARVERRQNEGAG